ncbi:hypothetical protein [Paenibacillus cremeus]|uniref:Uncharacterized protein n=1 Tax=Paenibacillus cremeus TaxID=2163881 RepID=A0A559KG49_9BACL|nr:hypothetical protein [Paenibacillus cremeus]TVY11078.1 hypothetical protein FPZ49_04310 [Paenibacillus cremeus]
MKIGYRSLHVAAGVFLCLLISLTACLTATAAPSSAFYHKFEPPALPPLITLFENTPLYPEPDESVDPWASISPQTVETVEAEKDWYIAPQSDDAGKRWIKIKTTWLGDMWIHLNYDRIGMLKAADTNIALIWSAALYSEPVKDALTDVVLSPQTVHCNAFFVTPSGDVAYRIETSWLGDQWLVRPNNILLDMEILNREMTLPTETLRMEDYDTAQRLQRPSEAHFIPPQTVFALEKTVNNQYHVRAEDGSTFWINPAYAQPPQAKEIDETIELSKETLVHLVPTTFYPFFGTLTPQKVKAFKQWDAPDGQRWYRIHSWNGDLWILPNQ